MHHRQVKHGIQTVEFRPLPMESFQFVDAGDVISVYAYFPIDDNADPMFHKLGEVIKENGYYTKITATCRGLYHHSLETLPEALDEFRFDDYAYSATNWKRLHE